MMLLFESATLRGADVVHIADYLQKLSALLSGYNETYAISMSMRLLADEIRLHKEGVMEHTKEIAPMFGAYIGDLNYWFRLLFEEGASRVDVLDQTIIANAQMLFHVVAPHTQEESESLEDIFDF